MNLYPIQKILVALDLSQSSLNALETAVALAKKNKAILQIVNVNEPVSGGMEDYLLSSSKTTGDVLNALTAAIEHAHSIKPELIEKDGHVVESIIKTALYEQSDLIVIGTHGASGFREDYIGSNAYNVIKHSNCPVLTIPPTRNFYSFKKVLFPIRPASGALARYDVVSRFLSANSSLIVLGVSNSRMDNDTGVLDKIVEEINGLLEADIVNAKASWGQGNSVSDDIFQFTQTNYADLIVLTSAIDAISKPNFIGPHTQKIINCSKVPVLNIKKVGVPAFA